LKVEHILRKFLFTYCHLLDHIFTDLKTSLLFDLPQIFTRLDNFTSHLCSTTKAMACSKDLSLTADKKQ